MAKVYVQPAAQSQEIGDYFDVDVMVDGAADAGCLPVRSGVRQEHPAVRLADGRHLPQLDGPHDDAGRPDRGPRPDQLRPGDQRRRQGWAERRAVQAGDDPLPRHRRRHQPAGPGQGDPDHDQGLRAGQDGDRRDRDHRAAAHGHRAPGDAGRVRAQPVRRRGLDRQGVQPGRVPVQAGVQPGGDGGAGFERWRLPGQHGPHS